MSWPAKWYSPCELAHIVRRLGLPVDARRLYDRGAHGGYGANVSAKIRVLAGVDAERAFRRSEEAADPFAW